MAAQSENKNDCAAINNSPKPAPPPQLFLVEKIYIAWL